MDAHLAADGRLPQSLLFGLLMFRELTRQTDLLRKQIIHALDNGALVANGDLDAEIKECSRVAISKDLIREVCGPLVLSALETEGRQYTQKQLLIRKPILVYGVNLSPDELV